MNRLAAMHAWPVLNSRLAAPASAALSRSASSSTTNGSLPPSSSTLFFRQRPAVEAMARPAALEPVRVTARTCGFSITASTMPLGISRVWNTPSGRPASRSASSSANAEPGTLEACFSSAALPASRLGMAKRSTCQNGKFHGITASTTPSGRNATNALCASVLTISSAR